MTAVGGRVTVDGWDFRGQTISSFLVVALPGEVCAAESGS